MPWFPPPSGRSPAAPYRPHLASEDGMRCSSSFADESASRLSQTPFYTGPARHDIPLPLPPARTRRHRPDGGRRHPWHGQVMRALAATAVLSSSLGGAAGLEGTSCSGYGRQTPRGHHGRARRELPRLRASRRQTSRINLCDLHTHTHAGHRAGLLALHRRGRARRLALQRQRNADRGRARGPLGRATGGRSACVAAPGRTTIEVCTWVFTSWEAVPGPGLSLPA